MEKIVILKTNRSEYSVKEAANGSITVGDLIEILRNYHDLDAPIVFSNDNGYTYGYITESVVDEEYWEEEEEQDMCCGREDMEYDLANAVRKNNDQPVEIHSVWINDSDDQQGEDHEIIAVGYDENRTFGVFVEGDDFYPMTELSDDDVDAVWNAVWIQHISQR